MMHPFRFRLFLLRNKKKNRLVSISIKSVTKSKSLIQLIAPQIKFSFNTDNCNSIILKQIFHILILSSWFCYRFINAQKLFYEWNVVCHLIRWFAVSVIPFLFFLFLFNWMMAATTSNMKCICALCRRFHYLQYFIRKALNHSTP